jgi:hypothetical protein
MFSKTFGVAIFRPGKALRWVHQKITSPWPQPEGPTYFGNAPAVGLYPIVIVDRCYEKVPKVFPWVVRLGHYKLGVLIISDRSTHILFFFPEGTI